MIVKCSHCQKILSDKVFNQHKCDIPLNDCKKIEVVYFQDNSYENKQRMIGLGIDGVLYSFEVVPRKAIPYFQKLADEKKHLFRTDEEVPEPLGALYK